MKKVKSYWGMVMLLCVSLSAHGGPSAVVPNRGEQPSNSMEPAVGFFSAALTRLAIDGWKDTSWVDASILGEVFHLSRVQAKFLSWVAQQTPELSGDLRDARILRTGVILKLAVLFESHIWLRQGELDRHFSTVEVEDLKRIGELFSAFEKLFPASVSNAYPGVVPRMHRVRPTEGREPHRGLSSVSGDEGDFDLAIEVVDPDQDDQSATGADIFREPLKIVESPQGSLSEAELVLACGRLLGAAPLNNAVD